MTNTIGLYIHIPFCKSKCPYCDFYSMIADSNTKERYVEAVKREIRKSDYIFDTVYFGGGTPSQIGANAIADILSVVNKNDNCEITVECNPSDTGRENNNFDFELLAKSGVNRISIGLQSAIDSERKALGRLSGVKEVEKTIQQCHSVGIDNISLDIMIGVPNQSIETLKETIDFCLNSGVKHISAYMLKIEEGTYYYNNRDKFEFPNESDVCDMYLFLSEMLTSNQFNHYEISNFALPCYESRHNLKYWHGNDYLGIGPAAHSLIDGKRLCYDRDIDKFTDGCEPKCYDVGGGIAEYIMLQLRLNEGIDFDHMQKEFSYTPSHKIIEYCNLLKDKNFANFSNNTFSLTPNGFLVSNTIIGEFLEDL